MSDDHRHEHETDEAEPDDSQSVDSAAEVSLSELKKSLAKKPLEGDSSDDEDEEPAVRIQLSRRAQKRLKKARTYSLLILVGLLVGIALGTTFMRSRLANQNQAAYQNPATAEKWTPTATTVFQEIRRKDEMVGVSQKYSIVRKYGDSNSLPTPFGSYELPFTENSMWYRYAGTIKAGVDLSKASYTQDGTTIHVQLPQPHIISNTPDMTLTGVLEERNNILNPIHVSDVDDVLRACVQESESEFWNDELIDECKDSIETNITDMYTAALGDDYTVEIEWVGSEE